MLAKTTMGLVSGLALMLAAWPALAEGPLDEITIAYYTEWPIPVMAYKDNPKLEEELGVKVNWVSFETGTAMSAAMASGDVQIALSQGVPPFVVAVSSGQDLQLIDIAVNYSDTDNCVVRSDLEIDKTNAGELAGKKVAVPLGTAAHHGFLRQMEHFGVPLESLQIVDMDPPTGAAALAQGAIDFACGYGGGLARMKEYGNVLLTGAEKEAIGILVFDATTAPADFIAEHEDIVTKFLAIKNEAARTYNSGEASEEMLQAMADASGMDLAGAKASLELMTFPEAEEQLSEDWLGGRVVPFMKEVAEVFAETGAIDHVLDSYEHALNTGPLKAASQM
ncbi:taurine ABC transporter substrate-binding protein [Paracoccus seriniphilus]|uniref:taurine ABC transporter substrate-binding protein n=1 Tax=Paracoccus seriniphilus TaxID=184748 RepID=UPI003569413A